MRISTGMTWIACGFTAIWGQTGTTVAGNSGRGFIYNVSLDAAGNLYAADHLSSPFLFLKETTPNSPETGEGTAIPSGYFTDSIISISCFSSEFTISLSGIPFWAARSVR